MQPFDYVVPKDYAEASAWLAEGNGTVRPLQGGTDLIIRARGGFVRPERVVDLKGLPGMRDIRQDDAGELVIGAACTMNALACHPLVQPHYDLLVQACNQVASYQLRNRATIGGNCCNASPAGDTLPALYCLEARAEIYGPGGVRCVPIELFITGPGRTVLGPGEFLIALRLPPALASARGIFSKLGRTTLGDISLVTAAVYKVRDEGRKIAQQPFGPKDEGAEQSGLDTPTMGYSTTGLGQWRIALGAVGPTPLRAREAEAALDEDPSPAGVERAAELAAQTARPISDIRASAGYRQAMVRVLVRRSIEAVLAAGGSAEQPGGAQ